MEFPERTRAKLESVLRKLFRPPKKASENEPLELHAASLLIAKRILQRCGLPAIQYAFATTQQLGLKATNSKVRFLAFLFLREVLQRSHLMRKEVFDGDFTSFVKSVVSLHGISTLPPPETQARLLHERALKRLREWNQKYGLLFPKIGIAVKFIEATLPSFYQSSQLAMSQREREAQQRERRSQQILRAQFTNVATEMQLGSAETEAVLEIRAMVDKMNDILTMLNPSLFDNAMSDNSDIEWDSEDSDASVEENANLTHLPNQYELVLEVPTSNDAKLFDHNVLGLDISDEAKQVLLNNLRDCRTESEKTFLPRLEYWIRILSRVELSDNEQRRKRGILLKLALQLKGGLRNTVTRSKDFVKIETTTPTTKPIDVQKLLNDELIMGAATSKRQPDRKLEDAPAAKKAKHKKKKKKKKSSGKKAKPFNPFAKR